MFDARSTDDQPDRQPLPAGLDEMRPGTYLGSMLATIDVDRVSAYDRVVVVQAHDRMVSFHQAQRFAAMTAVLDAYENLEGDAVGDAYWSAADGAATEVRAALHLTRRAADDELSVAVDLCRRLPAVWQALCEGRIDGRRARVIVDATSHLDQTDARDIAGAVLPTAPESTTGELRVHVRRLCLSRNPGDARRRFEQAVAGRRIGVEATSDGTANLCGWDLPPHRVMAISRWIHREALATKNKDETRSLSQIRADIFLDLLDHRCGIGRRDRRITGSSRGLVDIRVDLTTLAGISDMPGDLGGFGPVIADIARQVAADHVGAEWRFSVTDDGSSVASGTTRRRPTARHRRRVETRDERCVFPGCRMPASACDVDHITPWAETRTTTEVGTATVCRHDHLARHHGWRYHRTEDGDYRWVSPLGHTYTTSRGPPRRSALTSPSLRPRKRRLP